MKIPFHTLPCGRFRAAATAVAIAVTCSLSAPLKAAWTIDWGSVIPSTLVDSKGNTISLDDGFLFELGAFNQGFEPLETNTDDWFSNWNIFDSVSTVDGFNESLGYFTSTAGLRSDGTSTSTSSQVQGSFPGFEGLNAYLWIRNSTTEMSSGSESEWLLVRAQSWIFPEVPPDCCDNVLPLQWSVSQLTPSDIPGWGRQGDVIGPGEYEFDGPSTLQTYTIPEPGAALLVFASALLVFLHRRR